MEVDLRRAVAVSPGSRTGLFAAGKAAAGMFDGAASRLPRDLADGLVVLPRGYPPPRAAARVVFASHPEPDRTSVAAAKRAVAYFESFSPGDVLVCLVSGGASSLLCLPRPGLTLAEKHRAVRRLARSGAPIEELNRLRIRLSAVKGGRLARCTAARVVTLVLSDVSGDDPRFVGSGPTIRIRRGRVRPGDAVRVVGSNRMGLDAAAAAARAAGLLPVRESRRLAGEARDAGLRIARRALRLSPGEVLLAGGETTVELAARSGRGGRNLELALAAAGVLEGSDVTLLAAASDGIDGTSGAAGALADGGTLRRARKRGLSPERALAGHDTGRFFGPLGDLLVTGPTGTNVCDWVMALRAR